VEQAFFDRANAAATAVFGRPRQRGAMLAPPEEHEYRWTLGAAEIDEALARMQALEPFPAHWLGAPLVLHVRATFRLCAADSGEPFPDQDPALYGHQEAAWKRPPGARRSTCGSRFPAITR
jgi:hypothetical protein